MRLQWRNTDAHRSILKIRENAVFFKSIYFDIFNITIQLRLLKTHKNIQQKILFHIKKNYGPEIIFWRGWPCLFVLYFSFLKTEIMLHVC